MSRNGWIRPYSPSDRDACLAILDGNTPPFFVPADHAEYARFLDARPGPYFVIDETGAVAACGGWAIDADGVAVLTWGMVRRDRHRQGLGTALLRYRLKALADAHRGSSCPPAHAETRPLLVRVRTVQLVQGFFLGQGFVIDDIVANGFGDGLDRVTLVRRS